MKFSSKCFLTFLMCFSSAVFAGVKLKVDSDVLLLAVNGKEFNSDSFFSADRQVLLVNGYNQILVQLNAEFIKGGESEFESSETHVILFEANDADLKLTAPVIKKASQLKKFNLGRQWVLTGASGKVIDYHSAVLKKDGFQLARNYEYELQDFNKSDNLAALKVDSESFVKPVSIKNETLITNKSESLPMAEAMLKYWYIQADDNTRDKFKFWVSNNEKNFGNLPCF